jgi:hypothetical protein
MLTLVSRKYLCKDCEMTGKLVAVIKAPTIQIPSEFLKENVEDMENLTDYSLDSYKTERDEYGILGKKLAYKLCCEKCNSKNIELIKEQEFPNVMNFYPPGEAEKWYNHMN